MLKIVQCLYNKFYFELLMILMQYQNNKLNLDHLKLTIIFSFILELFVVKDDFGSYFLFWRIWLDQINFIVSKVIYSVLRVY